ncbi:MULTISPECIES: CHAT domain-containing protein [unclassified Streptomyces]|uniref:CHAT domain-containing protein n=1 Tax=unclassified Streptomyces TaxID=2593676 RepID=UPI0034403A1F
MNDEESGGVQGLRAWVLDATERARRLIPVSGGTVAPSGAYDSSVAELTELAGLLDHDPPVRSAVTVWLGAVLATRYVAGDGAPEDRERARRLLRDARDRDSAVGAGTDEEVRRWAALFLLMLVMPIREMGGAFGQALDHSAAIDWLVRHKGEGMADATAEMRALLAETAGLPVPPDLLGPFRQMDTMLSALSGNRLGPADLEQFADAMPPDYPHTNQLRMMASIMSEVSGKPGSSAGAGHSDPPRREEPRPEPRPEPEPEPDPIPASGDADTDADAHTDADAIALEAVFPLILGLGDALRRGDSETYNQYLGRMRTAHAKLPPGHELATLLEAQIGLLLQMSEGVGGNLQDQSVADTYKKAVADNFHQVAARSTHPVAVEFSFLARAFTLIDQVYEANKAKDADALGSLVAELAALEEAVPRGSTSHFLVQMEYADALTYLGKLTDDKDMMLRGVAYQEKALADSPAFVQEQLASISTDIAATRAALTGDPDLIRVPGPSDHSPHASVNDLYSSVLSLFARYDLTDDPADLDAAIATLERIRERVRQGQAPQGAASLVWQLAGTYWIRWSVSGDAADHTAATATAMESLLTLAADVVLQLGPEHGLLAARSGATRGVQTALWAGSHHRVEEALAALELGRALVLQTASTSRAVPELLQARGHHELAEAWRASGASEAPGAETLGELPGELPSTLRRRALEALGYRRQGSLFTTPTLAELSEGVAHSGADALVYLLPGEGRAEGMGIIVGADIWVVGGLPLLSGAESGPLERYLDAAGARSDNAHDPVAEQTWEEALSELCDWAYRAISPVFEVITEHIVAGGSRRADPTGPPRIVLVPCGRLGIVPWHAARFPAEAPHDYACQAMVITYAASGGQFLRTVRRARRDPAAAPVLLADPRMDLTHAEREVTALRETFYPGARVYGEFFEPSVEPEAAGTPDELVALLADAPSLLHVASHGSAGVRPTLSALHLAFPGRTDELSAAEGGPGAEPDLGMLTVTRLLDRTISEQDFGDGPLVVLSACQTDLSTRDHDEALTLTTAFVSAGARDVVGSRWTTRDGASVLLMAVFHHYVAVEGRSPVDALRAAQLWMLDPHRQNPGSLSGDLLRELGRPGLDRLSVWAPFIHQGHPGPADPRERTA